MDLNQHIIENDPNGIFHTNGYARVSSGDRLGAASCESFSHRLTVNQNRQIVGNYARSSVSRNFKLDRPRTSSFEYYQKIRSQKPAQIDRQSFRSKNYNPYN